MAKLDSLYNQQKQTAKNFFKTKKKKVHLCKLKDLTYDRSGSHNRFKCKVCGEKF